MAEVDRGPYESRGLEEKKLPGVVMVTFFVAVLFAASLSLLPGPVTDIPPIPVPAGVSYDWHDRIYVDSDAKFCNTDYPGNGVVSGNGTASNPYIIEGWGISAAAGDGIRILFTNAYFIVRDCNVHDGGSSYLGINLDATSNGIVSNNTCSNDKYGIYLRASHGNTLSNNTCYSNKQYGIFLEVSSGNTLSNNNCSNGNYGIYLDESYSNAISNNTCNSNIRSGMWLWLSYFNAISNNTCNSNIQYGMLLQSMTNNVVSWNEICNNTLQGIYLQGPNYRIWNNTFIGNNGAGSIYDSNHIQACDNGTNNWWNSTNGYGNYWGDWTTPDDVPRIGIVDLPYDITGTAGAKDYYPLTSPKVSAPPIPEFSEIIIPIVGLMLIALIFGRTRGKP